MAFGQEQGAPPLPPPATDTIAPDIPSVVKSGTKVQVIVDGLKHTDGPAAGEAACRPTVAAVANAIYDATGVRIRRVPFRDGRVLAALKAARV
jgi:CO/xanthine dehydrogenase Mo-binding subunit